MSMPPVKPVAIIAFDGLVVDTIPLRGQALHDASVAAGLSSTASWADAAHGRTLGECVRVAMAAQASSSDMRPRRDAAALDASDATVDETLVDLIALDASRRYRASLQHGISLAPGAAGWLADLGRTHRIVARADSARAEVAGMLGLASLESAFLFVRCSDDTPRMPSRSSLDASWAAIDARLTTVGIARAHRVAFECDLRCCASAQPFVAKAEVPTFRHAILDGRAERA